MTPTTSFLSNVNSGIHVEENEVGTLPHTIYKNELKMDSGPKKAIKPLEENIRRNLHHIGFHDNFLDMTSKTQATLRTTRS